MSHFTVLVIGQDPEKQLAPYHEFECTGTDDQYVQDIDETDEAREAYNKHTATMVKVPAGTVLPEGTQGLITHPTHGTLVSKYASIFQVPNPERGNSTIFQLPEGYEEIEVPKRELETFAEFVNGWYGREVVPFGEQPDLEDEHKYGYALVNESGEVVKVIRRTNPNKKWDWYQLGGRWSGFFEMKPGVSGVKGERSLLAGGGEAEGRVADQAFKRDIDFESMRAKAEADAAVKYDAVRAIIEPHLPVTPWPELRDKYLGDAPALEGGIEAAREAYHQQPAIKALRESEEYRWEDATDFLIDRDTYIRHAGIQSSMTFAVLKDGQWYERGSMGWWGMVSDEKDRDAWTEEFGKLVDGLSDDTLLSVYDCHI